MSCKLQVKKLTPDAKMPTQGNKGDCWDLYANADVELNSYESKIVPLGLSFNIPDGYRIKVFSRSSLPLKKKIIVSNSVGIIDTGYKNEVGLICHTLPTREAVYHEIECENGLKEVKAYKENLINNIIIIKKGDKLAQFQLEKIVDFKMEEVEELDLSNDRGGGFGSSDLEGGFNDMCKNS